MAKVTKAHDASGDAVTIHEIHLTSMRFCIVGTSPLVPHAVSFKAAGMLLFPAPKKNAAEKASSMKHEPYEEFRDAAYRFRDEDDFPTRLYLPAGAFHGAMASVAIDMVGAKKSQIGRLTSVPGLKIPIWGIPQIYSTIVRSSDMARTPDVRTLPILPRWAARVEVQFVGSLIKEASIANLLAAAGVIIGVGDGRPEKGKLTYGQFRLCSDDDDEFYDIIAKEGRAAQDQALADPVFFDTETEQLLTWFESERSRRSAAPAPSPKKRKTDGKSVVITSVEKPDANGGKRAGRQ